jgi:hypothetical protein
MSHPLGLPPLDVSAGAHVVGLASPTSPPSSSSSASSASLSCDYLSFGCQRVFATNEQLDEHLAHAVHAQKHLMLVQSAYVALHREFDGEKAAIGAARETLRLEQAAHRPTELERSRRPLKRSPHSMPRDPPRPH